MTSVIGDSHGAQLALGVVAATGTPVDEAMQGIAYLTLGVAAILAGWSLLASLDRTHGRAGAVLLGLAGATTTDLVLLLAIYYFESATVLPIVPTI